MQIFGNIEFNTPRFFDTYWTTFLLRNHKNTIITMANNEEIVMTAAKLNGNALMRLERKLKSEIDLDQVHHIAGGPYKGIHVNKTATSMDDVRQAEGRLEFMAYIHQKQDQDGGSIQDSWTIRFWFQSQPVVVNKNNIMTDYFRALVNPSMPKNYISFVKRALVVLREFRQIQRVELEVQESEEEGDDYGPIKSYISVFTPESYNYQFVPEVTVSDKTFVYFSVKASQDAHVALSAVYGDVDRKTYEIALGADGNMMSYMRDGSLGTVKAESETPYLLSEDDMRSFWISWRGNRVEVGKGEQIGFGRFLNWSVPANRRFNINCISVATSRKSKGVWEFTEIIDEYPDENKVKKPDPEKEARKAKARVQILWIAKKQRMLQFLEDAYPNSVTVSTLFRLCKIQQGDMISAAVVLKDLQKRGLIREISHGAWVRIQSEEEPARHEVKIVKEFPKFEGLDKIKIVIVTALYCEKLAVDSMIADKITYIVNTANHDCQVYTVGRIGNKFVLSTKFPLHSEIHDDMALADDIICKLHENLVSLKHMLLVGVAGSVPSYNDYNKHVRLGDVVVSSPTDGGAIYINCSKVEKIHGTIGYKYTTKGYGPRDQTLESAVKSLRQQVQTSLPNSVKPWEAIIEEGMEVLKGQESNFHRPSIRTDRLYFTKPDGTVIQCDHPRPTASSYKDGQTRVGYGVVGGGKFVSRTDDLRLDFAKRNDIKCYDTGGYNVILDCLDKTRVESYLLIRGISDYLDGSRKEWQCYASIAAASYMKALIMTL